MEATIDRAAELAAAYQGLLDRFTRWATGEDAIRAAVVIGSRARSDHPADEWADLDIIVFATDPQQYIAAPEWLGNLGAAWFTFTERTGDGEGMERRVLYEG